MSRQNDGASAFPQHPEMCDAHPDFQVVSLCDYFAADAMLAARSEQIPDPLRETAPDLLEALQTLLGDYRDLLQDYSEEREKDGWDAIAEDDAPAIAKARAAIARATGQEAR